MIFVLLQMIFYSSISRIRGENFDIVLPGSLVRVYWNTNVIRIPEIHLLMYLIVITFG